MLNMELQTGIDACKAVDLVDYISRVSSLKKVSAKEHSGPCPKCGGTDRFRVNDRGWFCRVCTGEPGSGGHYGDVLDFVQWMYGDRLFAAIERVTGKRVLDPIEIERIKAERQERETGRHEAERIKQAEARALLQHESPQLEYYANLEAYPEGRELWHERGLDDSDIDYYHLGFTKGRYFAAGDVAFESDTLTIPYYRYSSPGYRELIGLRHRLLLPNSPGGKYRPDRAGLGNQLFYTDHEKPMQHHCLIIEGEIKALVVWRMIYAWICENGGTSFINRLSVVGISGHSMKAELVEEFDACGRIWICLDPDADKNAKELAKTLGETRCKLIHLPEKIDDLINMGALNARQLVEVLNGSR
jgi:ribosomal protein L37AE/L43A